MSVFVIFPSVDRDAVAADKETQAGLTNPALQFLTFVKCGPTIDLRSRGLKGTN